MQKEIKTDEWKIGLLFVFFFGSMILISIITLLKSGKWDNWEYIVISIMLSIILILVIFRRKIYMNDQGLIVWKNTNSKKSQLQDLFIKEYISWDQIKRISFTEEDTKNYVFGKNRRRGTIMLQTGNEHIELRLVLNPEEVTNEIKQHLR